MYTAYLYTNAKAIDGEYLKEALTHDSCLFKDLTQQYAENKTKHPTDRANSVDGAAPAPS